MISVITCAYNAAETLPRTLNSLKDQTFRDLEIIVVNDGSTDETPAILQAFQEQYEGEMRFISIPNGGLANARNEGLAMAKGDFYCMLDADDYLEPNALERSMAVFAKYPEVDLCFFGYKSFEREGEFYASYSDTMSYPAAPISGIEAFQQRISRKLWILPGNAVYRMSLIREHEIRNHPGCNQGEDLYFISRYLFAARQVYCVKEDLLCSMNRQGSMTNSGYNESFYQILTLLNYLRADAASRYPTLQAQILPYVDAERARQVLGIVKRMIRAFSLKEYRARSRALKKEMPELKSCRSVMGRQKQLEAELYLHAPSLYYLASKIYDRRGG